MYLWTLKNWLNSGGLPLLEDAGIFFTDSSTT